MRIVPFGAWRPQDGQLVDANELNRMFAYSADALQDVSEKRYSKVVLPLSFVSSVSSGYVETTPQETRTYRVTPPVDVVVETAQLFANIVTASGVRIDVVQTSTGTTPAGCVSPFITLPPTSDVTQMVSAFAVNRFTLVGGQEYQFILSGTSFATARCDMNLNLSIDRWQGTAPTPNPPPITFSDADVVDADNVNDTVLGLDNAAALFASAPGRGVSMITRHNVSSSTSANVMRIELPRGELLRMTARITRVQVYASMSATTGTTVTAELRSQASGLLASAVANVAGLSWATGDSGVINVPMTGSIGTTSTPALDYSLRLVIGNTTTVNKCYAVVWWEF